ncbi:hypothetical protein ACWGE1_07010 [Streptomyces sp. NPDC054932]
MPAHQSTRTAADEVGRHIAHRDIGRHLRRLLAHAGFAEARMDVELVVYGSVEELSYMVSLEHVVERACTAGRIAHPRGDALLREQRSLSEAGAFHASINRSVLARARRP